MVVVPSSSIGEEIISIQGLPVRDAVVTQGRAFGKNVQNTWGLRPKMTVVFSQRLNIAAPAIWFKGTVQPLSHDGTVLPAFSYSELKYARLNPDSAYWKEQFEAEKSKWHGHPQSWSDFAALRTVRPTNDGLPHYEFDYYPCSFWLQEGCTHSRMELQIQLAKPRATTGDGPDSFEDATDADWSPTFHWNTLNDYNSEESKTALKEWIRNMVEVDGLVLDGYTVELQKRLQE